MSPRSTTLKSGVQGHAESSFRAVGDNDREEIQGHLRYDAHRCLSASPPTAAA
jgi:hypothetical protein